MYSRVLVKIYVGIVIVVSDRGMESLLAIWPGDDMTSDSEQVMFGIQ